MPSLTREKRPRPSEDEFVLFLQGIPAHCRWQELKDLVRQTALHIRQAVVYDDQHGFPTGLGQIIVKNEDEAWRTYQRLSTNGWDGQSLVVTLARTSSPTQPIAGPTKSPPSCLFPPGYVAGYSTPPSRFAQNLGIPASPISAEPPSYQPREYGPMISPMCLASRAFVPIFPDPLTHPHQIHSIPPSPVIHPSVFEPMGYTTIIPYPPSPMQPLHEVPVNSIQVNGRPNMNMNMNNNHNHYYHKAGYMYTTTPTTTTAPGATCRQSPNINTNPIYHNHNHNHTHPRNPPPIPQTPTTQQKTISITLKNLNPTTTPADLQTLFHNDTTTIKTCEMKHPVPDPKTGLFKSEARIALRTYCSPDEAKRVVMRYDHVVFMGSKVRVFVDGYGFGGGYGYGDGVSIPSGSSGCGSPGEEVRSSEGIEECNLSGDVGGGSVYVRKQQHQHTKQEQEPEPEPETKTPDKCQQQPLVINGSGMGYRTSQISV